MSARNRELLGLIPASLLVTAGFAGVFIQRSNALKGIVSLSVNGIAALSFALLANVAWSAAAVMALFALAGGFAGVRVARRLNRKTLRALIVVYGVIAATVLLARLFV